MAAYQVLLLNTAVPQIQAAQAGDTYVVPRDIAVNAQLTVTGNVGIGTSSPTTKLTVSAGDGDGIALGDRLAIGTRGIGLTAGGTLNIGGNTSGIAFENTTGANLVNIIYQGYSGSHIFRTGPSAEKMRLDSSGNLGIGTTSPDYKLQLSGTTGQTFSIERVASSIGSSTALGTIAATGEIPTLTADGASIQFLGAGTWSATSSPGRIVFNTTPAATTTPVERFQLAAGEAVFNEPGNDYDFRVESDTNTHALFVQGSDGNVGIGTSSPNTLLEISSSVDPVFRLNNSTNTVSTGADIGEIQFYTNDASTSGTGVKAFIKTVAGAFGANQGAALLVFGTTGNAEGNASERFRITDVGNVSIGGTADRATTVGTKALNIFDGTAPVGTLTNGISIYSSSGEAYVMDAAGNATLFSPHDAETNEWIFKSKHTPTGKVLKIDVERLLKFVNDHFGLDAVHEFIED